MADKPNGRQELVKEMRKCAGPGNFLERLTDDSVWEIFLKMRGGQKNSEVARWIHSDLGIGSNAQSVSVSLGRFKKRIPHLLASLPMQSTSKPKITKTEPKEPLTDLEKALQTRDELRELVTRLAAESQQTGQVPKELPALVQSLSSYERIVNKMEEQERKNGRAKDTGIPPEKMARYQRSFQTVVSSLQDNGELFIKMADTFLERLDQHAMTMEIHQDGTYDIHPRTEEERIRDLSLGICGGAGIRPHTKTDEQDKT